MSYRYVVTEKEAIDIMHNAIGKTECMNNRRVFVLSIDLEGEGISDNGAHITMEQGEKIIRESTTIIFSGNNYVSQLDLYSAKQDLENVKMVGTMKTILFPNVSEIMDNE